MENTILTKISNSLTEDKTRNLQDDAHFCFENVLTFADIQIEVEDLGELTFPLTTDCIQNLISLSSKAHFGLREETILDENVRNTYELKSDKLRVTINENSFAPMLNKMQDKLGLDENFVLIPHLHNMLIYGPGQFFDAHQDSEKLENMVATLVVVLPSLHIGGDLIIIHGKKEYIFSSETIDAISAKCIAFYSDCMHRVDKVKQGHRIALVYNLVLKKETSEESFPLKKVNRQLKNNIAKYFVTDACEKKLVYLLDYSYSEHSLRWYMLKGADRANSSALFLVAKELGLVPYLALVDIKEFWNAENYPREAPDYIIDDENSLSFWVDKDSKKLSFKKLDIHKSEICWTKGTESFEPFEKKYEGYTGNAGCTLDYWYKRAAIVLWPESSDIQMNFKLNNNALNELCKLTNTPGNEKKIMKTIEEAGKYLHEIIDRNEKSDFDMLVNIALYIKNKEKNLTILSNFGWKIFNFDISEQLVKLETEYGVDWCKELINNIRESKTHDRYNFGKNFSSDGILCNFHAFVTNFLQYSDKTQIIQLLLNIQSNNIINCNVSESLSNRMKNLKEILLSCTAMENIEKINNIIEHIISSSPLYPEFSLSELFLELKELVSSEFFVHYNPLEVYLVRTIDSQLALGLQDTNDWSINEQIHCSCKYCQKATIFLHSKTAKTIVIPAAKQFRKHIYQTFASLNLPIDLSTERTGNPLKLVMVKTEALHINAQKRFDSLKYYQQKLQPQKK